MSSKTAHYDFKVRVHRDNVVVIYIEEIFTEKHVADMTDRVKLV